MNFLLKKIKARGKAALLRRLTLIAPLVLAVFFCGAAEISGNEEVSLKDAGTWNYVSDASEVDTVASVLKDYRTGLSAAAELRFAEVLVGHSRAYGFDPLFVMALIKTESTFRKNARSHKGALGMMQILPSTARELARDLGLAWRGEEMLLDPSINVRLGIHYLSDLKGLFSDNMNMALAAYNRGPYNLKKRIRRGKSLSFRYVDKVFTNYSDMKEITAFN